MSGGSKRSKTVRFYGGVMGLYLITLLFNWYVFDPWSFFRGSAPVVAYTPPVLTQPAQTPPELKITVGKPVRIVIAQVGIDLPIEEGHYNADNQSWTLNPGKKAYFAMPSAPANDYGGTTFIYGHNNRRVFWSIRSIKAGDRAQVYTENGHLFTYLFEHSQEVKPDDATVFTYQGPPTLTVQTCSGSWNEWRQLFTFKLEKVESQSG